MELRSTLQRIVDGLLARFPEGSRVSLDEVGDALGATAASQEEIDTMLQAIEAAGRSVGEPEGRHGETSLRIVLEAARALRLETGRAPTATQIADRSGLAVERVRHALALARVISK